MKIQKLTLEGFRGFKEKVEFELHPNVNVFVGVNGSGKTSVLDAMSLLLKNIVKTEDIITFPKDDLSIGLRKGNISITVSSQSKKTAGFYITIDLDRKEKSDLVAEPFNHSYGNESINNEINDATSYYRANRFLYKGVHSKDSITSFNSFLGWYVNEENDENRQKVRNNPQYQNPRLIPVRNALNSFFSQIKSDEYSNLYVEMIRNGDSHTATYSTVLLIEKNNIPFNLHDLSDGEKMVILLVSDIARRLTVAYDGNISQEDILKQPGIILIDEIDLHLHPSWQRDIIPALTHVFPNVQFLVTTHSQQVLSNVKKESVHIIEDFKKVPLTPSIYGADSNAILWDIFGVKERPEHLAKRFSEYYRALETENRETVLALLEKLEEDYGAERTDIKGARMAFQFEYEHPSEA